jgi:hypothetical protein
LSVDNGIIDGAHDFKEDESDYDKKKRHNRGAGLSTYKIPCVRYVESEKEDSLPSLEGILFTNKKGKKENKCRK